MTRWNISRRRWIQSTTSLLAAAPFAGSRFAVGAIAERAASIDAADGLAGRMYKTLKHGMVGVGGSLVDRFRAAKEAGFDGIEMDSPGMNVEETRNAIAETGLPVDGTVCSSHWSIRHTSSDAGQRAKALDHLRQAIHDTHAVGGHTVLLVVGKGEDGPENEIWPRSIENIAKAVPLAARLGVHIAIENVWNQFLYNHDGGADQTAEKFVRYVDEFRSPWVGMQFDIGNHWKYGDAGAWIRQLGNRIVKLDVKGFSRKENKFTPIDEGDIDWAGVRGALIDIHFHGWVAAEVSGGDVPALTKIAQSMDQVFGLKT